MTNQLKYKDYVAKIEFSAEDLIFYGKIEGLSDLVTFECENSKEVYDIFKSTVDEYIEFCINIGKEPERPYNGIFNVRIPGELHRKIYLDAISNGMTLNKYATLALQNYYNYRKHTDLVKTNAHLTEQTNKNFWEHQQYRKLSYIMR